VPRVREAPGANVKRAVGLRAEVSGAERGLLSGCGSGAATVWGMLRMQRELLGGLKTDKQNPLFG
jgi:hypothetical protein